MISAKRKRPLPANDRKRIERENLAASKYCEPCNAFYDGAMELCPNCGNAKQQCSEEGCGRIFYAEAPGKCAVCAGGKPQPSAAERILPLKTCEACGEPFGAELAECPACAKRAAGGNAKSKTQNAKSTVDGSAEKALIEIIVDVRKVEVREQARKAFDEEKIAALAESIERDGLLQPPVVRRNPGKSAQPYVLVAGERRWRAIKQLGWSSCPVRLASGAVDDAQALLMQGEENVLREQFNDVELAEWCKLATSPAAEGGGGLTQEQLAKRLGVTQAEISNRIRLLRAPKWALEMVISGQMSRKHATELLPFEGLPAIEKAAEKVAKEVLKRDGDLGTASDFRGQVNAVAERMTAPLARHEYRYELGGRIEFEISEADRVGLATVKIQTFNGVEVRAVDKKAAEKLLEKAKREALAKAEAKAKSKGKGKQAGGEKPKLSAAEQKRRDEQLREQHKRRVEEWFYDWLREQVAYLLLDHDLAPGWLMLWAMVENPGFNSHREELLRRAVEQRCGLQKGRADQFHAKAQLIDQLANSPVDPAGNLSGATNDLLMSLFIDDDGQPMRFVPVDVVARLAKLVQLDVAAAWRDDRRSAMRQKFWELHSKEQLLELGGELKVPLLETQKKSVMVNLLLGQEKPLALPKALAALVKSSKFQVPSSRKSK